VSLWREAGERAGVILPGEEANISRAPDDGVLTCRL